MAGSVVITGDGYRSVYEIFQKPESTVDVYTYAITKAGWDDLVRGLGLGSKPVRVLACLHATDRKTFDAISNCSFASLKFISVPSHAKAVLFRDAEFAVFGSFNITKQSLMRNIEFAARADAEEFASLCDLFDSQWENARNATRDELPDATMFSEHPFPATSAPKPTGGSAEDGASQAAGRFDADSFVADLEEIVDAECCRDAAAVALQRPRERTRDAALRVLREALLEADRLGARSLARRALDSLGFEAIGEWTKDLLGERLKKNDGIDALIEHYESESFTDDMRRFVSETEARLVVDAALGPSSDDPFVRLQSQLDELDTLGGDDLLTRVVTALATDTVIAWVNTIDELVDDESPTAVLLSLYGVEPHWGDEDPDLVYSPLYAASHKRWEHQGLVLDALKAEAKPGRHVLVHVATGGGKTKIANDWLMTKLAAGERALWVTKDWWLLRQAAEDLCRRHEGATALAARLGGEARDLRSLPPASRSSSLVYTTIQTWKQRTSRGRAGPYDVVVVDEVHWGESGPGLRELRRAYPNARYVGLTATPRNGTDWKVLAPSFPFPALVAAKVLAKPRQEPVTHTGISWHPTLSLGGRGDYDAISLRELASNHKRNSIIVQKYLERVGQKTIVFTCDIEHAEELASLLSRRGVKVCTLHSALGHQERRDAVSRFKNNDVDVIVNVAMMTHGVDFADVRNIFLCRPTTSDILMSQMIGRGARLAPGKDEFSIVDFVDNLEVHQSVLITAERFLGGQSRSSVA